MKWIFGLLYVLDYLYYELLNLLYYVCEILFSPWDITSGNKCFFPTMSSSSDSDCDWRCQSFLMGRIMIVGAMMAELSRTHQKQDSHAHTDNNYSILLAVCETRARRLRLALKSGLRTCDRWASAGLASCHQWIFYERRSPLCWPVWWCRRNLSRPLWPPVYWSVDECYRLPDVCGFVREPLRNVCYLCSERRYVCKGRKPNGRNDTLVLGVGVKQGQTEQRLNQTKVHR